jgi:hypothetical protein
MRGAGVWTSCDGAALRAAGEAQARLAALCLASSQWRWSRSSGGRWPGVLFNPRAGAGPGQWASTWCPVLLARRVPGAPSNRRLVIPQWNTCAHFGGAVDDRPVSRPVAVRETVPKARMLGDRDPAGVRRMRLGRASASLRYARCAVSPCPATRNHGQENRESRRAKPTVGRLVQGCSKGWVPDKPLIRVISSITIVNQEARHPGLEPQTHTASGPTLRPSSSCGRRKW